MLWNGMVLLKCPPLILKYLSTMGIGVRMRCGVGFFLFVVVFGGFFS